jgi:Streptomycin adenylyltransferase.
MTKRHTIFKIKIAVNTLSSAKSTRNWQVDHMRSEKEMFDLILNIAEKDSRIRAVFMNGSRTNPNAPKDVYQDYDIVYAVKELETFIADKKWIDVFGERFILQMPETMRYPSGEGHFNWLMLFSDGNRLDLTLIPVQKLELIKNDSLSIALMDKDGILPPFPKASDVDYITKQPSELFYLSCCNNFWWCLQNIAKGIARNELPYAMLMYHNIVRQELHDMITWYIGTITNFTASAGKMGKYFKQFLPAEIYELYLRTYSDSDYNNLWNSIFIASDIFSSLALNVADYCGYHYNKQEEENMRFYLNNVKNNVYSETTNHAEL